ncbi:caspase-2-like [Clytia hemisphaerica]|uniref:Uncharacterized protein n=1 Tax=Clytia hemisphaerica TaxID=252671 RepID=A0A7M5UGI6_9CNID
MDKKHRKLLLKHRLAFVKDLEATDVSSLLYESGTITENDMESIEAIKLRRDRVEHLMDLLPRKGPKAFDGFINALEESKLYDHLASLLTSSKSSKDKKARDRGVSFTGDVQDGKASPSQSRSNQIRIRPRSGSRATDMLDSYPMFSRPRGWCFILNNMNFLTMSDRAGSSKDAANLQSLFEQLGFRVWLIQDADVDDIKEKITELAHKPDHNDGLVVCLLSHGLSGQIYGVEGNLISVSEILDIISTGPSGEALRGKPKLFLIQACRSEPPSTKKKPIGKPKPKPTTVEIISGSPSGSQQDLTTDSRNPKNNPNRNSMYESFIEQNSSHLQGDMLLGYSTFPGKVSWRTAIKGSFYIDAIVEVFSEFASSQDVFSMLVKVNQKVLESVSEKGQQQIPAPVVTLTKKLFLIPV